MSYDDLISTHCRHGSLLDAIKTAPSTLDKTPESISVQDLASVAEFNIGGRAATKP